MKISVVIPTYNEAKWIVDTLQQFQAVRGTDFEVIMSDNGSTDQTRAMARPLCDAVVSLPTDARSTIGECRNRGVRAASGDIIWFIDADVIIPNIQLVCNYIVEQLTKNSKLVGLLMPLRIYKEEARFADRFWLGILNISVYIQNQVLHIGAAPGDCQIIRRSEFDRIQGFDPTIVTSEDYELFHRLIQHGQVKTIWQYPVEMSPRRIRRDGWLKVVYLWMRNWFYQFVLHKNKTSEWEARR